MCRVAEPLASQRSHGVSHVCVGRAEVGHGRSRSASEGHGWQVDAEFYQPQEPSNYGCEQSPFARAIRQGFHEAIWDHFLGPNWRQALEGSTTPSSVPP